MSSIFTKIIQGEIPCYKVAEDEHHFAFLDINPIAEGHTLAIPKQETDYLFDVPDERLQSLILFSKKIAHALDASLSPIRTGVIVEGLEVPHAHIHLVPIYKHTQKVALGNNVDVPEERMEELAALIRRQVAV